MQEEFLPFCQRASDAFAANHQVFYASVKAFLPEKSLIGMRLTKNNATLGDYTVVLENAKISRIDNGVLLAEVHTPFGIIKPYYILKKTTLEKMIQDEANFIAHPFATKFKYFPELTIKFLK
jgi:hypothetical protein